jgi:anti-anti-sigma factor
MTGVEVEHFDGVPVARIVVDVDAANATRLRDQLAACIPHGTYQLVVDLSATRYLDSAGIDMLFRLHQRLHQRRGSLRLVIPPSSQLARLADIVALPSAVPVHDTLAAALAACGTDEGRSPALRGESGS